MCGLPLAFVSLAAFFSCGCFAQSALDQYHDEALVWEHYDTTIHMHADGTGDRILHVTARLQSEGAVRQFSVIQVGFASAYETGNIDFLRVHKADGTTVETPVADAMEMPAPVTTVAPLYSDLKVKQLPVRSLSAGDVIDYQLHTVRTKAEVPDQFWGAEHFLRDAGVVLSQTLTLEVPVNAYVQVWDPNHPTTPKQHDGVRTYSWSASQLTPTGSAKAGSAQSAVQKINDPDEDADGRRLPSVAWTTFHSWAEVGTWYRGLALPRSAPTPAIVGRANELTKDAKTPEEQVRVLYDFVSTRIHYVGIDFGVGRYQPHTAEEVMDHQYGDCKDKDTLLEALLRARGFVTAPALIGMGITAVPDLPSPALFNHVITTVELSGGRTWLDTTPGSAAFRVLVEPIRDQLSLVVPAAVTASLERTPADPPFPYFERFNAAGSLDKDGLLKSHMDMTLRSDNELGFRLLVQSAAPSQWDEAMQSVSRAMGFAGTVSNTDLKQQDPAGPVHLSYDYTRPSYADWENHRILPLFPVLEITFIDKDKAPEHDIDQGALRTLDAVTRIKLPEGYSANIPDAVHVKRDYASFDQTYRLDKSELIVERKVVILKKKVPKADWKDYYAYTKSLGAESGETYISLTGPPMNLPEIAPPTVAVTPEKDTEPKAHSPQNTALPDDSAQRAMLLTMKKGARQLELEGQWDAALAMLNEIKSKDPDYPYLWSMLGFIASHDGKPEEAIRDYEAELFKHHDDQSNIVTQLAYLYVSQKRYTDAEALLRRYLDRNDSILFTALAAAQTRSGDDTAALTTLQNAMATHPNDPSIEIMLAAALHRAHRDKEAVAMDKTLSKSADPGTLNSAAYQLAQMKLELPLAEAASRRAIQMLETASSQVTLQQAQEANFRQTNLLAATWDTLGWVLFQEGKPAEAEPYIRAAWFSRADVAVGDHLSQVLEALQKKSEALTAGQLALASAGSDNNGEECAAIRKNIERLQRAGATGTVQDATTTLRDMRTFRIQRPTATEGSGSFWVLIAGNSLKENHLVEGSSEMSTLGLELNRLKMPDALPPGSRAHLFRDGNLHCSSGTDNCEFVLVSHTVRSDASSQ